MSDKNIAIAKRIVGWVLFLFYLVLVGYIVFFARRRDSIVWTPTLVNILPVINIINSYREIESVTWVNFLSNLFGNIALFIPLPLFLKYLFGISNVWKSFLIGIGVSVTIEIIQYIFHIGIADVDDIILNSLGALLGAYACRRTAVA